MAMDEIIAILVFAGAIVLGLVVVRVFTSKKITVTFARLYGFLSIAVLGVALAVSNAAGESKTAAFTLLGTVAGYLAGAKPTTVPPEETADGGASLGGQAQTVL
jgi:hypothetical protein